MIIRVSPSSIFGHVAQKAGSRRLNHKELLFYGRPFLGKMPKNRPRVRSLTTQPQLHRSPPPLYDRSFPRIENLALGGIFAGDGLDGWPSG